MFQEVLLPTIVHIPVPKDGAGSDTVNSLFKENGIYWCVTIAPEIPKEIFNTLIPKETFEVFVAPREPENFLFREDLRYPSLGEALFAVGHLATSEAQLVSEGKPIRFLHIGFTATGHKFHMFPNVYLRQLVLQKKECGIVVSSVNPRESREGYLLVYTRNLRQN